MERSVSPSYTVATSPGTTLHVQLDLSSLPPIFVLPTHMEDEELQAFEEKLNKYNAPLTYDIKEAQIVIGQVGTKRRAAFELKARKLFAEEVKPPSEAQSADEPNSASKKRKRPALVQVDAEEFTTKDKDPEQGASQQSPFRKRRGLEDRPGLSGATTIQYDLTTEEEDSDFAGTQSAFEPPRTSLRAPREIRAHPSIKDYLSRGTIVVVKSSWLDDSVAREVILPLQKYIIYEAKLKEENSENSKPKLDPPNSSHTAAASTLFPSHYKSTTQATTSILERAKADAAASSSKSSRIHSGRRFGHSYQHNAHHTSQAHALLQQTTSEYEDEESDIPSPPSWALAGLKYACQRSTYANPPNQSFIELLKQIRLARILTLDDIGVRAYSTSIAAIAAYPHAFISPRELLQLPGCDAKIANLWIEYKNTGRIAEATKTSEDSDLRALNEFYNIWGVGAHTARDFYYTRGWRNLDDAIELGWKDLHRAQQIGIKYYDEFLTPIPRTEVEHIANVIRRHSIKARGPGTEVILVGGYRRGKEQSADVDVIISHRDLEATKDLIKDLVDSLEEEEYITHTLIESANNSSRGQATLPFRAPGFGGGHGFDSLDKALVVWQEPLPPSLNASLKKPKNTNIHRRVDIIISPWRTVGCAIMGWSGGTTFQRDVRRYAKNAKGWKFDSSGVRDRKTGRIVLLEGENGVEGSWEDAEKKVFEGLGLQWREPGERVTN